MPEGWAKVNGKGRSGYIKTTALRKNKGKVIYGKKDKIILLIEDDFDIRNGIRILLESQGYEIIEAKNGREGLKKLNETISLVILDIIMPEMSGIEVCKKLENHGMYQFFFLQRNLLKRINWKDFRREGMIIWLNHSLMWN